MVVEIGLMFVLIVMVLEVGVRLVEVCVFGVVFICIVIVLGRLGKCGYMFCVSVEWLVDVFLLFCVLYI